MDDNQSVSSGKLFNFNLPHEVKNKKLDELNNVDIVHIPKDTIHEKNITHYPSTSLFNNRVHVKLPGR